MALMFLSVGALAPCAPHARPHDSLTSPSPCPLRHFSTGLQCDATGAFGGRIISSGYESVDLASALGSQMAPGAEVGGGGGGALRCFNVEVELVAVMGGCVGVVSVCLALPAWTGRRVRGIALSLSYTALRACGVHGYLYWFLLSTERCECAVARMCSL